ncbi:MAG: tRNA pseudouridine(55) synthase TruB [Anaerolineae bacterium]|nr:tRNA pseudouridine(55) synthase TruB [Anaerolineae bacterium]
MALCTHCVHNPENEGKPPSSLLDPDRIHPVSRQTPPPLSGIFNVDKPAGMTSHDVVAAIRRAGKERRVGHAGTLDPMATGVLLVGVGSATRIIEYLMEGTKVYEGTVRLGLTTTTYDIEGEVTAQAAPEAVAAVTREAIEAALAPFRGQIQQVPPMYSALKREGRPLYELAREGIEVEREPRSVEISQLDLVTWNPPEATLRATVSKGTYIRSLAHDLGQALGVGGTLSALRRLAVGSFTVADAEPLDTLVEALEGQYWTQFIHPLDDALLHFDACVVDGATETAIRQGRQVAVSCEAHTTTLRAYNLQGDFIGLLKLDEWTKLWQPDKVFPKQK